MNSKFNYFVILLLLYLRVDLIFCLEKYWLGHVDWSEPANWLDGKLPDIDSKIVFPIEMRHAVGMPRKADFKFQGIELSRDGIVALPENGKIGLKKQTNTNSDKISTWLPDTSFYWVDPLNWNASSEAVPHLERLPCQSDSVVLPASTQTFSMRLPLSRDIEVQNVRLADDNVSLARWEWKNMKDREEFLGTRFSVKYSPLMSCDNCPCQEGDLSEYWEEVCNVQRPRCEYVACEYPLKVEGHCCSYCGGRIRLSSKNLLSRVKRVARNVLKPYESTVSWHSRLTWDGFTEVLVTEKGSYEGGNVIIALANAERAFKEEGIDILYTETSGGPVNDTRLAIAFEFTFGSFLVVLVLIMLLFPIFGYTYSEVWSAVREVIAAMCTSSNVNGRKKKSFAFARFENISEGNVQLTEEDINSQTVGGGERFENPLYGATKQTKGLDVNEPVSLATLEKAIELDHTEEIEMDIENL